MISPTAAQVVEEAKADRARRKSERFMDGKKVVLIDILAISCG